MVYMRSRLWANRAASSPPAHPRGFPNDFFAIVHILGQQQNFEIIFQLFHILTFFADFLLYHLLEVRVKCARFFQQSFGLSR